MRFTLLVLFFIASTAVADGGLISIKSTYNFSTTINRLETALKNKGMTIFTKIDHAKGAKGVGKNLRPTEVIIFGNPKIGTVLMQCEQNVAIDLPQKILVKEDENGSIWLSYNAPHYLAERHNIKACDESLKKVTAVLDHFAKVATQKD